MQDTSPPQNTKSRIRTRWKPYLRNWELYLLISPVVAYFILFEYIPMYGVQIAFKNFVATKGIWGARG